MVTQDSLLKLIRRDPFVPLRLYLKDGATHDLLGPSQAIVLRDRIRIGLNPTPTGVIRGVEERPMSDLVRVEELPASRSTVNKPRPA